MWRKRLRLGIAIFGLVVAAVVVVLSGIVVILKAMAESSDD